MQTQALHTARAVEGVAEVRNDITVRGTERSADQAVDDSVIEARVKSTLNDASVGEKGDVNVEVNNGVVQLSGFVANLEVKNRAADAASTVEGVRDVRNNIALSR
jgi:hyperosmotically inducible protein